MENTTKINNVNVNFLKSNERNNFIEEFNFDTEKLNNLILTGYKKMLGQIRNNSIVLVLGCTGSGKSTLINYLLSNKIKYVNHSMEKVAIAEKQNEDFPEIGHHVESKTLYPEVFVDKLNKLAYCDFPGFFDNRSFEERVSISINTQSAIVNAKNVEAIIVVLSHSEMVAQRGKLFKSLNKLLENLICDFELILSNIIFVLSKPNENITADDFYNYIEEFVSSSKHFIEEKLKNLKHKIKLKLDSETKERESVYKFLSAIVQKRENFVVGNLDNDICRNQIIKLIKSLKVKNISKNNFNFTNYDQDRIILNDFISYFAYHGLINIRNYLNYFKVCQNSNKIRKDVASKIEFYKQEIKRLENLMSENLAEDKDKINNDEKKKRSSLIEKRIEGINRLIQQEYSNLAVNEEDIVKVKKQIDEIETDDPVLYWNKIISDKRLKIFGTNSCTKKVIKYKGLPYIKVNLTKSNGKFLDEIRKQSEGIYEAKYKSEKGKDGLAKIEIYIQKKNLPDNVRIIKYLKENVLAQLEEEFEKINEQIRLYSSEKEYCNIAKEDLNQKSNKTKLSFEMKKINQKLVDENDFLARLNERDNRYAVIFEKAKNFIHININYFQMIDIIDETIQFNSSLINEFLNYLDAYNKSICKDESNKQPSEPNGNIYLSSDESLSKNFYCPISQYLMTDPYVTSCGHSFDFAAVMKYIESNPERKCPVCKEKIRKESIVPNNELKNIINQWHMRKISADYHETVVENIIHDENEFNNELENKKIIEDEIKRLKINLEIKEYTLKEIDLRIEKWNKMQKKLLKKEKTKEDVSSNQLSTSNNIIDPIGCKSIVSQENEKSISITNIPPPPQRKVPSLPVQINETTSAFTKPQIPPKPEKTKVQILFSNSSVLPPPPPKYSPPPLNKFEEVLKKSIEKNCQVLSDLDSSDDSKDYESS